MRRSAYALALALAMIGCGAEPSPASLGSSLATHSATEAHPSTVSRELTVASCAPTTFAQFPPDFPAALPPPVCIHGVAGLPASWCWEGCVDGGPRGPEGLPVAVAPFEVILPEESRITSASAFLPDAPDAHHYLEIESGTTLRGLPPRADMISVTVFWSEGGDASYFWAVATP